MSIPEACTRNWRGDSRGELLIGGINVSSVASRHGTPFFVYDHSVVEKKYSALRKALPDCFSISYSVKANPNPAFLRFFLEKGCGLEVASAGELFQAHSVGCPPEKILFAGPSKTESELRLAIRQGVGEIHAESALEIDRISGISGQLGRRTRVALRVNPGEEGHGGAMLMGGKSTPFGIDEDQLDPVLRRMADDPFLEFCGIHLFVGTQVLDHTVLLAQYRKGIQIARHASEIAGAPIHTLDFGGGLGIPYFAGDSELDLNQMGNGLQELMESVAGESCFTRTTFMLEPGRFLSGDCGVYVARVNDIKISRGKKYLVLDGGMNHHLAASGNLGQVIKRNFPVAILNKLNDPATEYVEIVGPLCTPLDTFCRSLLMPSAEVGDLVGIFQSGAYARSASPLNFLSHPSPPEVWVEGGRDFLIRRRGSPEDTTRDIEPLPTMAEISS